MRTRDIKPSMLPITVKNPKPRPSWRDSDQSYPVKAMLYIGGRRWRGGGNSNSLGDMGDFYTLKTWYERRDGTTRVVEQRYDAFNLARDGLGGVFHWYIPDDPYPGKDQSEREPDLTPEQAEMLARYRGGA